MPKRKKKCSKAKKHKKSTTPSAAGGHDVKSRHKYDKGGRVEAYTFGETLGKKGWP